MSCKRLLYLPKYSTVYSTNPKQWSKLIFHTVSSIPFANASILLIFLFTVSEYSQDVMKGRLCLPTRYKKRTFTSLFIPLHIQDQRVVSFRNTTSLTLSQACHTILKEIQSISKIDLHQNPGPVPDSFNHCRQILEDAHHNFQTTDWKSALYRDSYAKNRGDSFWHEQPSTKYVMWS